MFKSLKIKILKRLSSKNRLYKFTVKKIAQLEGGELFSNTIREMSKSKNVEVGEYSYGSCFEPDFNLGGKITIGKYCSIAGNVHYFGANHPTNNITMSPLFYNKALGFDVIDVERKYLSIGNDVWIGYNTIITSGCVKIGNGAVIGAGSVVTRDVLPYSIVAGNPAKLIRMRFDNEIISMIENSLWWENTPEELYNNNYYMCNPLEFLQQLEKSKKGNG